MRCVMNGGYHDGLEIDSAGAERIHFPFNAPRKATARGFPNETYLLRCVDGGVAIYDFESSEVDWSKVPWENLGG
jgi:hypothetical protein